MSGYAGIVMILHFVVELLLLLGADRLYGHPGKLANILLGAAVSGVYAGICLLSRASFLNSSGCRLIALVLVVMIAFGVSVSALRRGAVFILLNMALDGISSDLRRDGLWCFLIGTVMILLLCMIGLHSRGIREYIPVEITYRGITLRLTALCDTGNTLVDPLTGKPVLVINADAACQLTGLTKQQLQSPLQAMETAGVQGLRLIPYHTVGQGTSFMLALKMHNIKIRNKKESCLVAFAPEGLNGSRTYQALTGGVV